MTTIRIIFENRASDTGPNEQVFVDVHDDEGRSINAGIWIADGNYEALEIDLDVLASELVNRSEAIRKP